MIKAVLVSLLAVFVSLQTKAQITITQVHMPSTGDTIRYSEAPIINLPDYETTGTNHTWDFTQLGINSQALYEYKNSALTPYILNFGFSALGLKIADTIGSGQVQLINLYNFFKKSATGFDNVGIGFQYAALPLPQSGKHSDPDEIYAFPMNYNDSKNTTFSVTIPISIGVPIGNYYQSGTRQTVVDGWGKISTPYASNVNCLRLKAIINQKDSVSITTPAVNFGFDQKRIEYKWISTTEKIPMLEITGTEVGGVFTPVTVRYRDKYREAAAPLGPSALFDANKTMAMRNEVIVLTDKSDRNPQSWLWTITPSLGVSYVNGTNNTSQNPSVKFSDSGLYTVKLTATNPIGSNSLTKNNYINISSVSSISDIDRVFDIYPNPVSERLFVVGFTGRFSLTDASGIVLINGVLDENNSSLDLNQISNGLYFLELIQEDQQRFFKKIIKQ